MFNYWSMPCFYCTLRVNFSVAVFKTRTHLRRSFLLLFWTFTRFVLILAVKLFLLLSFEPVPRGLVLWIRAFEASHWDCLGTTTYSPKYDSKLGLKLTSNWSCTVIRAESKLLQQQSLLQKGILIGDRATRSDLAFCSTTRRISVKMREQMVFSLRQCHKQILA